MKLKFIINKGGGGEEQEYNLGDPAAVSQREGEMTQQNFSRTISNQKLSSHHFAPPPHPSKKKTDCPWISEDGKNIVNDY